MVLLIKSNLLQRVGSNVLHYLTYCITLLVALPYLLHASEDVFQGTLLVKTYFRVHCSHKPGDNKFLLLEKFNNE